MNSRFFNIDDLEDQQVDMEPEDRSGILAETFLNTHEHRVESLKLLSGNLPSPGEILFLWTVNSFNASVSYTHLTLPTNREV